MAAGVVELEHDLAGPCTTLAQRSRHHELLHHVDEFCSVHVAGNLVHVAGFVARACALGSLCCCHCPDADVSAEVVVRVRAGNGSEKHLLQQVGLGGHWDRRGNRMCRLSNVADVLRKEPFFVAVDHHLVRCC